MVVWERADDSTTCLPLYTSAVEGSRSTKRKKKSDAQKELAKLYKEYNAGASACTCAPTRDVCTCRCACMHMHMHMYMCMHMHMCMHSWPHAW